MFKDEYGRSELPKGFIKISVVFIADIEAFKFTEPGKRSLNSPPTSVGQGVLRRFSRDQALYPAAPVRSDRDVGEKPFMPQPFPKPRYVKGSVCCQLPVFGNGLQQTPPASFHISPVGRRDVNSPRLTGVVDD